jgi:hypothetical protein
VAGSSCRWGPLTPLNTSRSSKKSPLARRQCAPMSGLELLPKGIRTRCPDHHDHAYGDAETQRRALESGAEALLTKPIDFGR